MRKQALFPVIQNRFRWAFITQAYTNFDIATKTDPLFVKAYYYRGLCSEKKGDKDAAIADYKQANGMSPDYPDAKEALLRLGQKTQ